MRNGLVFVISAPSGTGKTTLVNKLLKEVPGLVRSVSVTTRRPRKGERKGRDYRFITRERFEELRKSGGLLEWARVFGNLYGTPREDVHETVNAGKDILLEIDVQGAMQVKKKIKGARFIFVMPPSKETLAARLRARSTENGPEIEERLRVAEEELKFADRYDYRVVNDNIENAVEELKRIVCAERDKE